MHFLTRLFPCQIHFADNKCTLKSNSNPPYASLLMLIVPKTGASYAMYEQNEHFQRTGQSFTTQKCSSQKDKL